MDILKLVWHLLLHIFFGTLAFVAIGFCAVLLHWFVQWVEQQGILIEAIYFLKGIEYFIFAIDGFLFIWFMIRVSYKFGREIWESTK